MISNRQLNPSMLLGKNAKSTLEDCSEEQKRLLAIECIFNNGSSTTPSNHPDALTTQRDIAKVLKKYISTFCFEEEKEHNSSPLSDQEPDLLGSLPYDEKIAWAMDITFHTASNHDIYSFNKCRYDDSAGEDNSFSIILYKANEFNKGIKRLLNKEDNESYKVISDATLGYQDFFREFSYWFMKRLEKNELSVAQHLGSTIPKEQRSRVMQDLSSICSGELCSRLNTLFVDLHKKEASCEKNRMFKPFSVINSDELSPAKEGIYRL